MNRCDRGAALISTDRQGRQAAGRERVRRRSRIDLAWSIRLGRRETPAGLSHTFVERYQWPIGALRDDFEFHGPLDRAVHFIIFWR